MSRKQLNYAPIDETWTDEDGNEHPHYAFVLGHDGEDGDGEERIEGGRARREETFTSEGALSEDDWASRMTGHKRGAR